MANTIKLACVYDGQVPALFTFDQTQPLAQIISDLCERWGINDAAQYSFKDDTTKFYITEKNRFELKDGVILKLALTPSAQAQQLITQVTGADAARQGNALKALKTEAKDLAFATKFVEKSGEQVLRRVLGSKDKRFLGDALGAYSELLHHGLIDLATLSDKFIQNIISLTSSSDSTVVRSALRIMSAYVYRSPKGFGLVHNSKELAYPKIINHCNSSDLHVQEGALSLVNSLITSAPDHERLSMFQQLEKSNIFGAMRSRMGNRAQIPYDMARELFVFQRLWLNRLQSRADMPFNPQDETCKLALKNLLQYLPDMDEEYNGKAKRKGVDETTEKWRKLGFDEPQRPETQFLRPPGVLALDSMAYFAVNQQDLYNKVVLDQLSRPEEYSCPFARMSCAVVTLLMRVLEIGQPPPPNRTDFLRIFYSKPRAFKEMFCVTIQLASKTWREMEAKLCDFDKVMTVVTNQIQRVLLSKRQEQRNMDELKDELFQLTYQVMLDADMEELHNQQGAVLNSSAVQGFKKRVQSDLLNVVKEERLAHLCDGAFFYAFSDKSKLKKEMKFFAMLAPNHKTLHWGDPVDKDDQATYTPVMLPHQCEIGNLKMFFVGKDVPSVAKIKKSEDITDKCFGVMGDGISECLEFVAQDRETAARWLDGMRILMGKPVEEEETKRTLQQLIELEMSLRMLDMTGVKVGELNPTVPPLPTGFDFYYETPGDESAA